MPGGTRRLEGFSVITLAGGAFAASWLTQLHRQVQENNWSIILVDPTSKAEFPLFVSEDNRALVNCKFARFGAGAVFTRATGHWDKLSFRLNLEVEHSYPRVGRVSFTNKKKDQLTREGSTTSDKSLSHFELAPKSYGSLQYYAPGTETTYIAARANVGLAPEECVFAIYKMAEGAFPSLSGLKDKVMKDDALRERLTENMTEALKASGKNGETFEFAPWVKFMGYMFISIYTAINSSVYIMPAAQEWASWARVSLDGKTGSGTVLQLCKQLDKLCGRAVGIKGSTNPASELLAVAGSVLETFQKFSTDASRPEFEVASRIVGKLKAWHLADPVDTVDKTLTRLWILSVDAYQQWRAFIVKANVNKQWRTFRLEAYVYQKWRAFCGRLDVDQELRLFCQKEAACQHGSALCLKADVLRQWRASCLKATASRLKCGST